MTTQFKGFCFVGGAAGADKLTDIPRAASFASSGGMRSAFGARRLRHWMHALVAVPLCIKLTNLFSFCVLPGVQMATKEPVATLRVWMALICVSYDPADYWTFFLSGALLASQLAPLSFCLLLTTALLCTCNSLVCLVLLAVIN